MVTNYSSPLCQSLIFYIAYSLYSSVNFFPSSPKLWFLPMTIYIVLLCISALSFVPPAKSKEKMLWGRAPERWCQPQLTPSSRDAAGGQNSGARTSGLSASTSSYFPSSANLLGLNLFRRSPISASAFQGLRPNRLKEGVS